MKSANMCVTATRVGLVGEQWKLQYFLRRRPTQGGQKPRRLQLKAARHPPGDTRLLKREHVLAEGARIDLGTARELRLLDRSLFEKSDENPRHYLECGSLPHDPPYRRASRRRVGIALLGTANKATEHALSLRPTLYDAEDRAPCAEY